jgi:hypothetical protein
MQLYLSISYTNSYSDAILDSGGSGSWQLAAGPASGSSWLAPRAARADRGSGFGPGLYMTRLRVMDQTQLTGSVSRVDSTHRRCESS